MSYHSWNSCMGILMIFAAVGCGALEPHGAPPPEKDSSARASGVCPPFQLRDEAGNLIDPAKGINDAVPYSPRQTCGADGCHDYEKITEGYHFTQGRGEEPTPDQKRRVAWATTPGNYGGTWCSPAPLYRYLSPKTNETARTMDMTSFSFLSTGCGSCHPGGGSAEYDRDGKRYDHRMADPRNGLVEGGENGLDGDYYKARWNETGVLEADCLLCHMPGYDMAERKAQIAQENYRWAATAGSGFASVTGKAEDGQRPEVRYDTAHFDAEGRLKAKIVREPRNEACLACHAKPGWKKRGANFRARTDVHLRAGLKCVDCHDAGSRATDPRIRGEEVHQFAKGDDPGGRVRDDLDNTMRDCNDCHTTGELGAPIAEHAWLPPLHLEQLACQTCHIPERAVKAALVQAGDVFNPGARIPSKGKHLWTFYGPDGAYWNHYGDLEMMGYDDKPSDPFRPVYARYGGKIFPVNRVHSAWPGIEIEGRTALMQPRMGDVYKMWSAHRSDAKKYPRLAEIEDDNGDGVIEVNRPNEIEALIASISDMLERTGYPMDGKRVVWVADARVYSSGTEHRTVETEPWEASPYANVHKYTHDIYPAKAALGSGGCADCHSAGNRFFFGKVLERPFGPDGEPVWTSQSRILGYNGSPPSYTGLVGGVAAFFKWLTIVVMVLLIGHILLDAAARFRARKSAAKRAPTVWVQRFNNHFRAQHLLILLAVGVLFLSGLFLFGTRYPGARWAATLTGALGGLDFWRVVHRLGGALLVVTAGYHLVYSLIHEEGRRDFRLMLPTATDFRHLGQNLLFFFGRTGRPPEFGRFTYFEKFDYWAVFWGCLIMIGTGLAMWFNESVRLLFPGMTAEMFDAFKEAHAHEAVLAFSAIVIWHMYNIHLRPGRFPGSFLWIHGRIDKREQERDHPAEV